MAVLITALIQVIVCIGLLPVLPSIAETQTVVIAIDQTILHMNQNIQKILDKSNFLTEDNKPLADVQFVTIISDNNDSLETLDKVCAQIKDGAIVLVDMTSPNVAALLRSFASTLGIAYISVVDNSYFRYGSGDASLHYYVEPTAVEMLRVVADIVIADDLNNVAIVYDETFDIQNTPRRILTNVPAQHLYVKMSDDTTVTRTQIEMLKKIEIRNIFIIGNSRNAPIFLEVANTYTNFEVNWFFLTKDSKLTCLNCKNEVRVIVITATPQPPAKTQYDIFMKQILDPAVNFNRDSFKTDEALVFDLVRLIKLGVNTTGLVPIVYPDCYNISEANDTFMMQSQSIVNSFKQLSIHGVYGPLDMENDITRYRFTLQINQKVFKNGNVAQNTEVGNWTEALVQKDRLKLASGIKSLTKSDKKKFYRIVTVAGMPPFVYKTSGENGTKAKYEGYCIDLLDRISFLLDFEYDIYESPDKLYGAMDDDGNWNGAIKELIDKKADIAVGPISVMAERENVVDFTVPYYDLVGLTILMKKPEFDYSLVKFLSVLDEDVWFCIIGAFFLFSILICVFDKLSPFSYQNNTIDWNGEGSEPRVFTLKEGIWFCMMSLTPQGGGETPRALSGRLVAATWWLFGFIIIATYTANLAAFLTVSRLETPIESLDDLSNQFKVKYAPTNGSNALIYFKRMADIEHRFYGIWKNMSLDDNLGAVERAKLAVWDYPVSDKYTKLWETMQESGFPSTKDEAMEKVLTGEFAYIGDATVNKYATLTQCELWEVGEEFSRKPYALAVQEGSPLRSELSNVILQLINQRELEAFKTKWWQKDELDCPDIEDESDGISIKNIGGVFLVIVIGSALALITLAIECYW
ncbi:ionotropic receptor 25a isoform X2 [Patella vulgata]|nr:ionotropic receptor 25a isoform X2 [Patella vulgata]